jgi:hypothetical protein
MDNSVDIGGYDGYWKRSERGDEQIRFTGEIGHFSGGSR